MTITFNDFGGLLLAWLRRRQTQVTLGFIAVAAGIAVNALFLQPRQHPAPFFNYPEEQARAANPDEIVRAVQDELKQIGFYSGPLDGLSGPQTQASIAAFERQAGRPETGQASVDLLVEIRTAGQQAIPPAQVLTRSPDTAAPTPQPAAPQDTAAGVPSDDPRVALVQQALARAAYGPLDADGRIGPDTRAAIMQFQRDHNISPTGEISDSLIVELRASGALDGG